MDTKIEKLFNKFLEKAKAKFGDKFDYSKVEYTKADQKIIIICPIHGEFITTPSRFLQSKYGCSKCATEASHKSATKTTEQFIEEAKEVWGDRFSYENTKYVNSHTKVTITCPIHGDFQANPTDFLRKHGCPKCKGQITADFNKQTKRMSQEDFINRIKLMYGNLFNYDEVIYVNKRTKVKLHSNIMNEDFLILPEHLFKGEVKNCYLNLSNISNTLNNDIFKQRAIMVHGNKYDYSKIEYKNLTEKVRIICPEHGEFWQTPTNHLYNKQGCPKCNQSHGERFIPELLEQAGLQYVSQYKITANERNYEIDFCLILNSKMVFIEYNGKQHYEPVEIFGGKEAYDKQVIRDNQIREYCKENDIILLEYSYEIDFSHLQKIIENDLKTIESRI